MGKQVILVSSGAIAGGHAAVGWHPSSPADPRLWQAAAAADKWVWRRPMIGVRGARIAQCASAADARDLPIARDYLNARSTLMTLLDLQVVPVINENEPW